MAKFGKILAWFLGRFCYFSISLTCTSHWNYKNGKIHEDFGKIPGKILLFFYFPNVHMPFLSFICFKSKNVPNFWAFSGWFCHIFRFQDKIIKFWVGEWYVCLNGYTWWKVGGKSLFYYQNTKVPVQDKTNYASENEGKFLCVYYCLLYVLGYCEQFW